LSDNFDAVVVGAGCAGAVFSAKLAARGFRVLMLDRRRDEELGHEASDLVESEAFDLASLEPPSPPEAGPRLKGLEVMSPDTTARINISDHRLIPVDRKVLSTRLLERARETGVDVRTQHIASGVEIDRGAVVSVVTDRGSFGCRLAVDASGLERALCRDIPRGMGIPRMLRASDYISVYREVRNLEEDLGQNGFKKGYFTYHVGLFGGYSWVHADEGGMVDIGTGVQDVHGAPDPREIVLGYVRSNPGVGERVVHRGGGRIPTRRPLETMVAGGMMLAGDAACQATPVIGRGVGGAMIGANLAADAAAFALEAGDVSTEGLWSYNYEYMRNRGANLAALDCTRLFLQRMSDKDFSFSLAKGLIDDQSITGALRGQFQTPTAQTKFRSLFKGFRDVPLLVKFDNLIKLSQKVLEHYQRFPREYDPPVFAEWSQEADYLFDDIEKLSP